MAEPIANPLADRSAPYGARQRAVLDDAGSAAARAEIASWQGYAPTPLRLLDGLGCMVGYKDEAGRFGLGSFKALGGAYAVQRQVALAGGRKVTVACATDGNHGRSVAWGAARFGAGCVIYVHETVSSGRIAAIAAYGAEVRVVPGTYDDAVRQAAADAAANGWIVVSDTSYPGYTDIPRDVMQGYTVMAAEALEQWPGPPPTHCFLQAGVGGMAAAVVSVLWRRFAGARPLVVTVEPERAACVVESVRRGRAASVGGGLDTLMAGLACGETSLIAWELLEQGADFAMTVSDDQAVAAMRLLAARGIIAGESAVAGLAGFLESLAAGRLGLGPASRVLLFGSEGDTDPELYRRLVA